MSIQNQTYTTPTNLDTNNDLKAKFFRDIITYVCGGSALFGILAASSLFLVTVGVRRISLPSQSNI